MLLPGMLWDLLLTGRRKEKIKTLILAVTDEIQVNCCKVSSDNRQQPLFLTKPNAVKKVRKAQDTLDNFTGLKRTVMGKQ